MGILGAKYKAHKFINYIFYIVVFVLGFLVGAGFKKINFSDVFGKIFFIDSVYAYERTSYNVTASDIGYNLSSSSSVTAEYSYNFFNSLMDYSNLDYSFSDFSNVIIKTADNSNTATGYFYCSNSYTFTYDSSYGNLYPHTTGNCIVWNQTGFSVLTNLVSSDYVYHFSNGIKATNHIYATQNLPQQATKPHLIDVSPYTSLTYNEDLFDDDSNFKKVCVNNYDTFSITSNSIQDYDDNDEPVYSSFDFLWFQNGVKGLSTYLYDSETETRVTIFEQQPDGYLSSPYGWYFWLNSRSEIDTYWNSPNSPGLELTFKGYTDKYKYYNYTLYPFQMVFTTEYHRYQVFWFKNAYIEDLDGNKSYPDKYCFYIKNEYDVNILSKNSMGDVYSDINILGGMTFNDKTYESELNTDTSRIFSNITNFISRMHSTIFFINNNIFALYTSMPLIVRLFVLTFLTIAVIKILIGMVVR